jgi:hypothetical protein
MTVQVPELYFFPKHLCMDIYAYINSYLVSHILGFRMVLLLKSLMCCASQSPLIVIRIKGPRQDPIPT